MKAYPTRRIASKVQISREKAMYGLRRGGPIHTDRDGVYGGVAVFERRAGLHVGRKCV
jgi:hypothetical protein